MNDYKQLWTKAVSIDDPGGNYNGFNPSVTLLPRGYCHKAGYKPLELNVIWERDQAVTLRDGTVIYTDIFRPDTEEKVPVIISWSPYGKSNIDLPWAYDSPELSHLQKEEGVDPGLWCKRGYAVAHPDARGSYMSEGNLFHWGQSEGRDIYDYVEWLAGQKWCNERVGMAGNSYLSIVQWFGAAEQPPHLAAAAPWEGQTDAYREVIRQGGILDNAFPRQAVSVMHGNNYIDDMPTMAEEYPLMNAYWEDKRARLYQIEIPLYIVASYTNPVHTFGTFRGYRETASKEKWLRIHNSHEWVDFYDEKNQEELMKFFDYYLKKEENGWKSTPAVRYSLLNPGGKDETDIADSQFPPAKVQYIPFYLQRAKDSGLRLAKNKPETLETVDYSGEDINAALEFEMTFDKRTCFAGYPKAVLTVEGIDCEDMDLFVEIGKKDADGRLVVWDCTPPNRYQHPVAGFDGRLRVSLREVDGKLSSDVIPEHKFIHNEWLKPGEAVKTEIAIRPLGLIFEAGETLVLRIGNELRSTLLQNRSLGAANRGEHRVYMGGERASYVQLPVLPV